MAAAFSVSRSVLSDRGAQGFGLAGGDPQPAQQVVRAALQRLIAVHLHA
jgi:hypothetical protein